MKKLINEFGSYGYAVYFYCLELIAGSLENDNITFELEDDAELIGQYLKIDTLIVEKIMKRCIELKLFELTTDGIITCFKLGKFLDQSYTRNPELKQIIEKIKDLSGTVTDKSRQITDKSDQIRLDKIRLDKTREDKNKEKIESPKDAIPANDFWKPFIAHYYNIFKELTGGEPILIKMDWRNLKFIAEPLKNKENWQGLLKTAMENCYAKSVKTKGEKYEVRFETAELYRHFSEYCRKEDKHEGWRR